MKTSIITICLLKYTILNHSILRNSYIKKHPNQKYKLDDILHDILYILKTGISWRQIRSNINYNTLFWHFKKMIKYNIFKDTYLLTRNSYYHQNKDNINTYLVDSTFIQNKNGRDNIARNKFF